MTTTSKNWARYLVAASGTATVAASSASASIIYRNPSDLQINLGTAFHFDILSGDVDTFPTGDGDSTSAFLVRGDFGLGYTEYFGLYALSSPSTSAFVGSVNRLGKLSAGDTIDAGSSFSSSSPSTPIFFDFDYYSDGYWNSGADGTTGYVGLKFEINAGETHYGWARFTYNDASNNLVLHDFAYETEVGVGILAGAGATAIPEPASAGMLAALAAGGVAAYRRRRQAA